MMGNANPQNKAVDKTIAKLFHTLSQTQKRWRSSLLTVERRR